MRRWVLVLALLPLPACDFASLVFCTATKPREQCVRELVRKGALETEGSKALSAGALVSGDAGVYSLRVPSDGWIQLASGRNHIYPDRDLRLLHEVGATVDGFTPAPDGRSLEEMATSKRLESATNCEEIGVPEGAAGSTLTKCCDDPAAESGVILCSYSLAMAGCDAPVVVAGMGSPQLPSGAEIEEILLSVRCVE